MIRARRRASATIAFFIPLCLAIYRNTERISGNALLNLLEVA